MIDILKRLKESLELIWPIINSDGYGDRHEFDVWANEILRQAESIMTDGSY